MKSYKQVENEIITSIGKSDVIPQTAIEITEENYNQLILKIQSCPSNTLDTIYYLSNESESYIGRETTHGEKVDWYVQKVTNEAMTIEEVPEDYREEVRAKLPIEETKYTLDEASNILAQEVSKNGYNA